MCSWCYGKTVKQNHQIHAVLRKASLAHSLPVVYQEVTMVIHGFIQ